MFLLKAAIFLGRRFLFCTTKKFCSFDDLFGAGTDPVVLGQVDPTDSSGGVEEKFGRTGDVATVLSGASVNKVITLDGCCVRIGQDGEGQTGFLRETTGDVWRIDTDGDGTNTNRGDLVEVLLDTPQLGVA